MCDFKLSHYKSCASLKPLFRRVGERKHLRWWYRFHLGKRKRPVHNGEALYQAAFCTVTPSWDCIESGSLASTTLCFDLDIPSVETAALRNPRRFVLSSRIRFLILLPRTLAISARWASPTMSVPLFVMNTSSMISAAVCHESTNLPPSSKFVRCCGRRGNQSSPAMR